MTIDVLTLFPKMFTSPFEDSLIKRAVDKKIVTINYCNLRDFTKDKHRTVDARPYGGGPGMVMMVEVVDKALEKMKTDNSTVILLTPQGNGFNQKSAVRLSKKNHLIMICGHYEGFDERIRELVDEEISIGDYVLTGGEIPAMVVIDSVVRLLPEVVGNKESIQEESFSKKSLEYPQYTRPDNYNGMKVPKVLLSGNHADIQKWRDDQSMKRTKKRRPDLLE